MSSTEDQDTIDGVDREQTRPPPVAPSPPTNADYTELISVESRHYERGNEIGHGGMARVVAARDLRLGRSVAIKELLPRNRADAPRFIREARITARLQHPGIIHVYEAGRWASGEPFFAMNRVEGARLGEVIKERKSLDERLALLPNVIAVAEALAYAHSENVIHRDLKPSNVLVGAFGETVVIDWGLAKELGGVDPQESLTMDRQVGADETGLGRVVGTPAYMPPEQARGTNVDTRVDVYALGAVLYHVITGKPPYDGDQSERDTVELVLAGPCSPVDELEPQTPIDLVTIVNKAMAREPTDRYSDAGEILEELKKFQAGQLIAARNYTKSELVRRWFFKHRLIVGIVAMAVVAIAVVGSVSISRILHEKRKEELRRNTLLEERGRSELLAGQAGRAIVYLAEAAKDGVRGGARGLLLADAMRPFEAQVTRQASSGAPDSVAFSADGKHVITLDEDRVWIDDRSELIQRTARGRQVLAMMDGGLITIDDDGVARVWTPAGALRLQLKHDGDILDAHLSSDGRWLATGSADGKARVWDLEKDTPPVTAKCGGGLPVNAVRLSPQGNRAVSATNDNVMCYWDTSDGTQQNLMRGHRGKIHSIRWSRDATRRQVLTASADGTALLWDPFWGKPIVQPIVHDGRSIVSAEFSSDGRMIVTAGADQQARLWAIPDEIPQDDLSLRAKEVRRLVGHTSALNGAVFDARDERIATAGTDHKAKVWDVATGELLATFEHADVVTSIAFSPDPEQQLLLTASTDGSARVWDLSRDAAKRFFEADAEVNGLAVAADGSVAAARADSRVSVWRAGTEEPTVVREHAARVLAIAYSPDGRWLVSGGEDQDALLFETSQFARIHTLRGHQRPIRTIAFSQDGSRVATAGDEGLVRIWSVASGGLLRTLPHVAAIRKLAISADGIVAAVDDQGRVAIWGAGELPQLHASLTNGNTRAIAFSDDGSRLVASGTDTKVFRIQHGVLADRPTLVDGPTGEVRAVTFTRDAACVITAGVDGLVQLWDADKGKLLGTRGTRGATVNALATSADGATLWVGGADQLVRAWDIHAEARDVAALGEVMERVPWRIDDIDVVRRTEIEERTDGQHR